MMFAVLRRVAQTISIDLIGLGFGGILHLHLQHQVAAAFQVEPQMDVLLHVRLQLRHGQGNAHATEKLGESDDAEQADQHGCHNHARF